MVAARRQSQDVFPWLARWRFPGCNTWNVRVRPETPHSRTTSTQSTRDHSRVRRELGLPGPTVGDAQRPWRPRGGPVDAGGEARRWRAVCLGPCAFVSMSAERRPGAAGKKPAQRLRLRLRASADHGSDTTSCPSPDVAHLRTTLQPAGNERFQG